MKRLVVKTPHEAAAFRDHHELTYEMFRDYVGGYIEMVPLPARLVELKVGAYCDEEGRMKMCAPNFPLHGDWIVGTVVFFGIAGSDECGLTGPQIRAISESFGWSLDPQIQPVPEAG